ncbi:hypothetical protein SprV_0501900000 [Sparganum proliferum]
MLWAKGAVRDCMQIGFHLSANVVTGVSQTAMSPPVAETTHPPVPSISNLPPSVMQDQMQPHAAYELKPNTIIHRVSLAFDRQRITSCSCTCTADIDDDVQLFRPAPFLPPSVDNDRLPTSATAQNSNTYLHSYYTSDLMAFSRAAPAPNYVSAISTVPSIVGEHVFQQQPSTSARIPPDRSRMPYYNKSGVEHSPSFSHSYHPKWTLWKMQHQKQQSSSRAMLPSVGRISPNPSGALNSSAAAAARCYSGFVSPYGIWCSHVVATCLLRIRSPNSVLLRAPISESLSKLSKVELQKFAQNLICQMGAKKILPAAQSILDQLLTPNDTPIKRSAGAPDPTAGGAVGDLASWSFDGNVLEEKLRISLRRFCAPKSVFYSDLSSIYSNQPNGAEEYSCLLRSLRSNEPRGVWDLLSVISDMFRRHDKNGVPILDVLTRCMLEMEEIMTWWYIVQLNLSLPSKPLQMAKQKQSYYSAAWLCEEVIELWRLACLDPELRPGFCVSARLCQDCASGGRFLPTNGSENSSSGLLSQFSEQDGLWLRGQLARKLISFHRFALERAKAGFKTMLAQRNITSAFSAAATACCFAPTVFGNSNSNSSAPSLSTTVSPGAAAASSTSPGTHGSSSAGIDLVKAVFSPTSRRRFIGFKPALLACRTNWSTDLPPTYALSREDFKALMPRFDGAYVATSVTGDAESATTACTSASHRLILDQLENVIPAEELELFMAITREGFPSIHDELEADFAKCQALAAHGLTNQAVAWARYLALQTLLGASALLHKARLAAEEGLRLAQQISLLKSSSNGTAGCSSGRSPADASTTSLLDSVATATSSKPGTGCGGGGGRKHRRPGQCNHGGAGGSCSTSVGGYLSSVGGGGASTSAAVGCSRSSNTGPRRSLGTRRTGSVQFTPGSGRVDDEELQQWQTELARSPASSFAVTMSYLMNRVQYLMDCLTYGHESAPSIQQPALANRRLIKSRALERGTQTATAAAAADVLLPLPRSSGSMPEEPDSADPWASVDIELAFRLGILLLALPRPPLPTSPMEVRLLDQEVAILNRLYRLPLERTCPWVIDSIRQEAQRLISEDSLPSFPAVRVPYSLVNYLFHLLAGSSPSTTPGQSYDAGDSASTQASSFSPSQSTVPGGSGTGGARVVGPGGGGGGGATASGAGGASSFSDNPLGAILDSPSQSMAFSALPLTFSLPLALRIQRARGGTTTGPDVGTICGPSDNQPDTNSSLSSTAAVREDSELGFAAAVSVLRMHTRVPECVHAMFVEGQRTQMDVLALQLLRFYKEDTRKLSQILQATLNRDYNPAFKAPPLWACLEASYRELINFRFDAMTADAASAAGSPMTPPPATAPTQSTQPSTGRLTRGGVGGVDSGCDTDSEVETDLYQPAGMETDDVTRSTGSKDCSDMFAQSVTAVPTEPSQSGDGVWDSGVSASATRSEAVPFPLTGADTSCDPAGSLLPPPQRTAFSAETMDKVQTVDRCKADEPASGSEDTDTVSDTKAWAERFRCATLRDPRKLNKHSVGMAAIDSSAPETTSSDNSPTACRRFLFHRSPPSTLQRGPLARGGARPGGRTGGDSSRSASSLRASSATRPQGRSVDASPRARRVSRSSNSSPDQSSLSSSGHRGFPERNSTAFDTVPGSPSQNLSPTTDTAGRLANEPTHDETTEPGAGLSGIVNDTLSVSNSLLPTAEPVMHEAAVAGRSTALVSEPELHCFQQALFTQEKLLSPSPPRKPTELMAFHIFQLAKSVRLVAGGPSASGSVFIADVEAHGAAHRNLQLAAFQIGLYALGLYNSLHPSWQSRTYSRHVTWVSQQVFEIGLPAAFVLYHSWRNHLNAAELAAVAFQLSRERDRTLVNLAAELCLASLTDCATLKPHEILRALSQCQEHSAKTLERGLLCIEKGAGASPYGILPEIHFHLARSWFDLYEATTKQHKEMLSRLEKFQQLECAAVDSTTADVPPPVVGDPAPSDQQTSTMWLPDPSVAYQQPQQVFRPPPPYADAQLMPDGYITAFYHSGPGAAAGGGVVPVSTTSLGMVPQFYSQLAAGGYPTQFPIASSATVSGSAFEGQPTGSRCFRPPLVLPPQAQQPQQQPFIQQEAVAGAYPAAYPHLFQHGSGAAAYPMTAALAPVCQTQSQQQVCHPPAYGAYQDTQLGTNPPFVPPPPPPQPQPSFYPQLSNACAPTATEVEPISLPYLPNAPPQLFQTKVTAAALISAQTTSTNIVTDGSNSSATATGVDGPSPEGTCLANLAGSVGGVGEYLATLAALGSMTLTPSTTTTATTTAPTTNLIAAATAAAANDDGASTSCSMLNNPATSNVAGSLGDASQRDVSSDSSGPPSELEDSRRQCPVAANALSARSPRPGEPSNNTTSGAAEPSAPDANNAIVTADAASALENKAHLFLRRAFFCAMCAIKKLFHSQMGSVPSQASASFCANRASREAQHSMDGTVTAPIIQPDGTSTAGDNMGFWNEGARVGSADCSLPSILNDSPHKSVFLPVSAATKNFDAQILWTLEVADLLGPHAVHEYCSLVLQCIQCPLLMKEVTNKVLKCYNSSLSHSGTHWSTVPRTSDLISSNAQFNQPLSPAYWPQASGCNWQPVHSGVWQAQQLCGMQQPPLQIVAGRYGNNYGVLRQFIQRRHPPSSSRWAAGCNGSAHHSRPQSLLCSQQQPQSVHHDPHAHQQHYHNHQLAAAAAASARFWSPDMTVHSPQSQQQQAHLQFSGHPLPIPFSSQAQSVDAFVPYPPHPTIQQLAHSPVGKDLLERMINRTHSLFHKFINQRLRFIGQGQAEWDEFVDILLNAYNLHLAMPATDRELHWDNLLTRIHRHHKCSSALWQRILAGIQTADLKRT